MRIDSLFPTPVGINKLERDLTDLEKTFLLNQSTYQNTGNISSLDTYILNKPELSDLRVFIQQNLNDFFDSAYKPSGDLELYITQSWVNYTRPKEFHHRHNHANSIISGVFYIDVDNQHDKIYFHRDMANRQIDIEAREYHQFNCLTWFVPIENNMLVLFPSIMTHSVEQTLNNVKTRSSLAFNTFVRGFIGTDESMTGLKLS
jgi:uncharacterized protein (TIGR02466 family)